MCPIELVWQIPQAVLAIQTRTSLKDLAITISNKYEEIINYLNELEDYPTGSPYTAYYNWNRDNMDIEVGLPVKKVYPCNGDICGKELPKCKAIVYIHKGPYTKIKDVYAQIVQLVDDNEYEIECTFYEYYHNSPDEVPESELLTKVVVPLKDTKVSCR